MRHLVVCLLIACGGSSSGTTDGGGGGGTIAPEDYTDALADAQCDREVRCERYEDRATCDAANILVSQEQRSLLAAIADGTVIYDGEAAKRCLDLLRMQGCTFPGFHVDSPCDDIFTGTVASGGACFIDRQCATGGSCDQNDPSCDTDVACCIGTCAGSVTESPLSGPCNDGMHVCANDAYCNGGVCTALVATEGASCTVTDACANPMYCNLDFTTGTGACKTAAASGTPCVRSDLRPCADSRDYCDANLLICVRSAGPGESCANAVCVDYAKCIANSCVADRKLGETCLTGPSAADCAGTLECTGGTCQAPPSGMTCAL